MVGVRFALLPFAQGSHVGVRFALLPFAQGSHGWGRFALPPFAQGAHGLAAAASRPLSLFPLIRGCTPLYASPYGKGRCHGVTEGIRKSVFDMVNRNVGINPQKGRHLLCTFCPCEKRKQGETSGNAARDKPAVSRTAARRR